jgi:hypothetical protein
LNTTPEESARLRGWLGDGLVSASRQLSGAHSAETRLLVVHARAFPLDQFGELGLHGDEEDLVAGALTACRGELSGAALLHMDPEAALAWARSLAPEADPIATFLGAAEVVLGAAIRAASDALALPTEVAACQLVEETLGGCLLATHAPPDTVLIGAKLQVETGQEGAASETQHEAFCHLLLDAKLVSAMLQSIIG